MGSPLGNGDGPVTCNRTLKPAAPSGMPFTPGRFSGEEGSHA